MDNDSLATSAARNSDYQFTYLGRQTRRKDGIATRMAILDACLTIVANEGIRGVRHRAVAEVAQVSLAATTYYFEDIQMLIHDSLIHFAELAMARSEKVKLAAYQLFASAHQTCEPKPVDAKSLVDHLSLLVLNHIYDKAADVNARRIERIFYEEAIKKPLLAKAIVMLENMILDSVGGFFDDIGVEQGRLRAHGLVALIRHFEYYLLIDEQDKADDASKNLQLFFNEIIK
ncbi:MAG: TetR/AcrR family transcriptional regulator [Shewanella sp.]